MVPRLPARFHVSRSTSDPARCLLVSCTGLSPSLAGLSRPFHYHTTHLMRSITPERTRSGLGSFHFARRYFGNRVFFLFLALLRCFSSGGSRRMAMEFTIRRLRFAQPGFPIQRSPDQRIFAPPRSLSQLITSFIGS